MTVIRQAAGLEVYTANAVFNYKLFPKKYRPVFTGNILDTVFEINDCLISANELDLRIPNERAERFACQRRALRACKKLMNRVHTAHEMKIIGDVKFAYWERLIVSVKNLTGAWLRSDEKRGFASSEAMKGENL
jgi:hypothetical protein